MSEFKLSFTANEINEKLGKIDNLAEKKDLPTKTSDLTNDSGFLTEHQSLDGLATETYVQTYAQPVGDYALRNEIPNVESAIIDVIELPTGNINEGAFYRLTTAYLVFNQNDEREHGFNCVCVNGLPEVGQPVTTTMTDLLVYYNTTDGDAYGYINDALGSQAGAPAGWYTLAQLAPLFNVVWNGVITDINDDPCDDSFRLLLSKDFYIYQDGWCKLPFACEKAPKFDITWDGVIGDRIALDMSMLGYAQGVFFVKVSDDVFSTEEMAGWYITIQENSGYVYDYVVEEYDFDTSAYPGAFIISNLITVLHDADALVTALGLPSGVLTNGIYFLLNPSWYVSCLAPPPRITKIDEKYLLNITLALASVAKTGDYNDLYNKPTVYTDVIRYGIAQDLSYFDRARARSNIDVYSKSEVDAKVGSGIDLSDYATKEYVDSLIISAIGGSY